MGGVEGIGGNRNGGDALAYMCTFRCEIVAKTLSAALQGKTFLSNRAGPILPSLNPAVDLDKRRRTLNGERAFSLLTLTEVPRWRRMIMEWWPLATCCPV